MVLFSVIIPTCHRNEALIQCLASVAPGKQEGMTLIHGGSQDPKCDRVKAYEVIVTDDGFRSTAEPMLQEAFPWAKWVSGPRRGPAANRNHGAEKAVGDWLVFVDDDCVPEPTLLAAYARAAVAGNCSVLEGRTLPQGNQQAADMECPINISGGCLWSCNFAIKRRLFIEIGGFDENFQGPFMEDIDMYARLSERGHTTIFVSDATVKHPWRPRRGLRFLALQARSAYYYTNKHPESGRWLSLTCLVKRVVRVVLRDFPKNLLSYRGRGALRMLTLDLVLASFLLHRSLSRGMKSGVESGGKMGERT